MLAVAGGKGGCGKTTSTLALARALAASDRRVITLDADVDMPDLHAVAGTPAEPGASALLEGAPVDACVHRSPTFAGVEVLPAPADSRAIGAVADHLERVDATVVVDTPAGASRDVSRPLRHADRTILVTTPTRASLLDAAKSAAVARTLEAPPVGTVVTKSDGSVDPEPLLSCPTLCHVPSVDEAHRSKPVRRAYAECISFVTKRNV